MVTTKHLYMSGSKQPVLLVFSATDAGQFSTISSLHKKTQASYPFWTVPKFIYRSPSYTVKLVRKKLPAMAPDKLFRR